MRYRCVVEDVHRDNLSLQYIHYYSYNYSNDVVVLDDREALVCAHVCAYVCAYVCAH